VVGGAGAVASRGAARSRESGSIIKSSGRKWGDS